MLEERDEDDFWSNRDLRQQDGVVSVWLDVVFSEDNDIIGWYDHDYAETGGIAQPRPLATLFEGYSWSDSWVEAAITAAARQGITEATYGWVLYDHVFDAPPGPLVRKAMPAKEDDTYVGEGAVFLGTFPFEATPEPGTASNDGGG